jgi:predicted nucleic acid-binding Zn ribbon protein
VDGAFCIDEYLELLRAEYKRKRNFMKLLDGIG